MGKYRYKSRAKLQARHKPKQAGATQVKSCEPTADTGGSNGAKRLVKVALAAWRTARRANKAGDPAEVLDAVRASCDRMMDALNAAGVEFKDYERDEYDENLKVNVVDVLGDGPKRRVKECLEPAVVVNGELMHVASVVVEGEE